MPNPRGTNRYSRLIEAVFFRHWREGATRFEFHRDELKDIAGELEIELPDNLGDLIYSFRYRAKLPQRIRDTQPAGLAWRIVGAGTSRYRFVLAGESNILPRTDLVEIGVPAATPEVITAYALDDEQALLAIVRYNRLIDIFLGLVAYSLQNHLRTNVRDVGQVEVDEMYVGIDRHGAHYAIPVQAKGGTDRISAVQTLQDIAMCADKFPGLRCRPVSVQFLPNDAVAMFELTAIDDDIKVVQERHYRLLPAAQLDSDAVRNYRD